jgi:4-amino-4-deoxy-L-arabinose transferase-like glycosyltransferase
MSTGGAVIGSTRWARVGGILVLAFFGLPLFIGLGEEDLRNDEAIYSYSVDRMLETGDWLTPRAIPFDGPFLEKPPLKVWIAAGLIRSGLVPSDERGLRFADALFGAIAFLYVYALGHLLAGPICGGVAVLVLFTFGQLVFVHGVRSNNMEAGLLLAYAGAMYHFARWDALTTSPRKTAHALAVGAYFAFGFMMKFVAVLFLPLICAGALMWRSRDSRPRLSELWRAWLAPAVLAVALCAPWFVAASLEHGRLVWNVMFGDHVFTRFTGALDPAHLAPWTAYLEWIWGDLVQARTAWLVVAGGLLLSARAWIGRPWLARLFLLWFVVPIALMSMGSSKLPHYAFPYLPPLALAAGYAVALVVGAITGPIGAFDFRRIGVTMPKGIRIPRALAMVRGALVVVAVMAFVVALWTVLDGRLMWNFGAGLRLSNASVERPLVLGAFLLWLGAAPLSRLHTWVVVPLMVLLIVPAYEGVVDRFRRPNRPLSTLRACAVEVQRTSANAAGHSVYNAASRNTSHPFFYYLRSIGPMTFAEAPSEQEIRRRLVDREDESPMIVSRDGFTTMMVALRPRRSPELARVSWDDEPIDSRQTAVSGVTDRDGHLIVVLPGPYQACVLPVVAAGWIAVGDGTTTRDDR